MIFMSFTLKISRKNGSIPFFEQFIFKIYRNNRAILSLKWIMATIFTEVFEVFEPWHTLVRSLSNFHSLYSLAYYVMYEWFSCHSYWKYLGKMGLFHFSRSSFSKFFFYNRAILSLKFYGDNLYWGLWVIWTFTHFSKIFAQFSQFI